MRIHPCNISRHVEEKWSRDYIWLRSQFHKQNFGNVATVFLGFSFFIYQFWYILPSVLNVYWYVCFNAKCGNLSKHETRIVLASVKFVSPPPPHTPPLHLENKSIVAWESIYFRESNNGYWSLDSLVLIFNQ